MYLTTEQCSSIEEMAYRLYSPNTIAIALELDCDDFLSELHTQGSQIHKSFYTGYLRQLDETRANTIKAAQNGSNPAQIELLKFFREIENELKYG